MEQMETAKKLSYTINTIILILVFGLAGFFVVCHVDFLVWFSIPTALVYVVGYYLIRKERLDSYIKLVYFWLTLYMGVTTICVGYKFGFHLYCFSMILVIFYTEYMAEKLGNAKINALAVSGVIVACYLASTGYVAFASPLYEVEKSLAAVFWLFNSAIVLFFLISYSRIMLKMVGEYEKKLTDIALTDRLTGLYNRHYMISQLEAAKNDGKDMFVAMIDIDDFKKINDVYGHNAGDYILKNIARLMKEVCTSSDISRWGGEEFLILTPGQADTDGIKLFEEFRKKVAEEDFCFEDRHIAVTVTTGIATLKPDHKTIDEWIKDADDRLYYGKKNGKNRVVLKTE